MLAFVISDMLGQKAGCYLATYLLCQELARLGMQVTCFAQNVDFGESGLTRPQDRSGGPQDHRTTGPQDHGSAGSRRPDRAFEIVRPLVRRGCRWDWPGRCLAWQARRQIQAQNPAYVIVMGTGPLARHLLGSSVANRLLIWELTNATPGNKFVDPEASRLLGRCRAMLSPSAAIDRGIRETYRYNGPILRLPFWIEEVEEQKPEDRSQKSEVRGQGMEEQAESRKQKGPESDLPTPLSPLPSPTSYLPSSRSAPPDFIFLGRRDVEKGLHELVRATAEVAKEFPGVRVLITGQGSEEPFLSLSRQLGLASNVRFQFFRTREDTMQALANSRYLVLPSYHEGYPLVLLEAAQSGVPFIATAVGSVAELYGESAAAVLISPRDEGDLAEAMLKLMSESADQYRQRREAAHQVFVRLSSAEAVRRHLQNLILALAQTA